MRRKISDDSGQMLPFLAVVLLIMIGFAFWGLGRTWMFERKSLVRDAADAAVLAALDTAVDETLPTWYSEVRVCVERDEEGGCTRHEWRPTEKEYQDRKVLNETRAAQVAREYFEKNLQEHFADYSVLAWDISFTTERRPLQIYISRYHTSWPSRWSGYGTETFEEEFPRWWQVDLTAKVRVRIAEGDIFGVETVDISHVTQSQVALPGIVPGSGGDWQ